MKLSTIRKRNLQAGGDVMTSKSDRWNERIVAVSAAVKREFGHLDAPLLNARPSSGSWSVAQNLDHVIRLNESYGPVVDQLRGGENRQPFTARLPFLAQALGRMLLKAVQPDRKRKMRTFPVWEPRADAIPGDIVPRFLSHQEELQALIASCDDLVERQVVVISSPANRHIVYTLDAAFDVIVAHEERHLAQAREALATVEAEAEAEAEVEVDSEVEAETDGEGTG